jgi:hypothetical protein
MREASFEVLLEMLEVGLLIGDDVHIGLEVVGCHLGVATVISSSGNLEMDLEERGTEKGSHREETARDPSIIAGCTTI